MAAKFRVDAIEKLNGGNYTRWRLQISLLLKAAKLWTVVDGTSPKPDDTAKDDVKEAWESKDVEAMAMIVPTLDATQTNLIYSCETAKEMFDRLKDANSDSSALNKQHTLTKFLTFKIDEEKSPVQAMIEMEELQRSLKEMKVDLDESLIIAKIVSSLPEKYTAFKKAWDSVPEASQTRAMLMSRLKKEELENSHLLESETPESARAFVFKDHSKFERKRSSSEWMKTQECFGCGKFGHFKRECQSSRHRSAQNQNFKAFHGKVRDPKDNDSHPRTSKPDVSKSTTKYYAFMGKVGDSLDALDWVCDTGATHHICGDRAWYTSYNEFSTSRSVTVANNGCVEALGKGTIELEAFIDNDWVKCTLYDVFYIPGAVNLFSEVVLAQKGYRITRDSRIAVFMDDEGTEGPFADFRKGLYFMRFRPVEHLISAFVSKTDTTQLWHQRLGHINCKYIQQTCNKTAVRGMEGAILTNQIGTCEDCQLGKQSRTPFPRVTFEDGSKPGEKIHVDLAGPMPIKSLEGDNYFLLFKDHVTGFRCVYFLKKKSETAGCVQDFFNLMETQTGRRVKTCVSDNGTEILNRHVKQFFHKQGINHETSAPYCPESNGKIEREIRTIKDTARTMLIGNQVPENLWRHAVATAVYIHNRVLDKQSSEITSFQAIMGKVPSVSHIRIFGCTAYAHVPNVQRRGFQPKGKKCMFVGYGNHNRKWKLFDADKNAVFESSNVTFCEDEHQFATFKHVTDNAEEPSKHDSNSAKTVPIEQLFEKSDEEEPTPQDNPANECANPSAAASNPSPMGTKSAVIPALSNAQVPIAETEASPPVSPPTTRQVVVHTELGDFLAEIPEGADSAQIVVSKPKTKKSEPWFKPQILPNRLRERTKAKEAEQPNPKLYAAKVADVPDSYKQALASPESKEWLQAMQEEIGSQEANKSWEVVPKPDGVNLLDTRWVFKKKFNTDGSINRHKARLVVRGYKQEEGIDYTETFAAVARYESIRLLLIIAAALRFCIVQFDVKTAFLYGELKETLFAKLPEGYRAQPKNTVLRLLKSIYGLKQAPRCWAEKFSTFLSDSLGLGRSEHDPSVYFGYIDSVLVVLALYVDDGLVMSICKQTIDLVIKSIGKVFEITTGPPTCYVGLQIHREGMSGDITIHQRQYIHQLLERFHMTDCNPCSVPMQPYTDLLPAEKSDEQYPFRQLIGALLFLAKCTRPDIAFAVSKLSQFVSCFNETHWKAGKNILRYLKGTSDMGIVLKAGGELNLEGFSDADHAGDKITRKSTSGVVIKLNGAIVSWSSQKQACVALSSTEAEYVAIASGTREIVWLRKFLSELGFPQTEATILYVDNQSAIKLVNNPEMHSRTKHIDVRYHYIRGEVAKGEIKTLYVPTDKQLADGLTKPLMKGKLEISRAELGLRPMTLHPTEDQPISLDRTTESDLSHPDDENDADSTPKATIRGNSARMYLPWISMAVLSLMVSSSVATVTHPTSPPVMWRKSKIPVTVGHHQINVLIKLVNPCDLLSNASVPVEMVPVTKNQCDSHYEELFMKELKKMCPQKSWTQISIRKKRVIDIIIGIICIIVVASAGVGIAATTITSQNAGRLDTAEERLAAETGIINQLEKHAKQNFDDILKLQGKFNEALTQLQTLQTDHDEMKGKIIPTNFAISYILSRLMIGRSMLWDAQRNWKQGKITPAFLDYFNFKLSCGDSCPIELARAQKCEISEDGDKLFMNFEAPEISDDLTLVEADAFQLMARKRDHTCTIQYTGPQNAIISNKNKCVYAVNLRQPVRYDLILAPTSGCRVESSSSDTKYFSVSHCEKRYANDQSNFIQIKPQNGQYHIYCPESNFTYEGVQTPCPDDVFSIQMISNFKIDKMEYNGSRISIVHQETLDHVVSMKANLHLQPSLNWTSLKIEMNATEPEFPILDSYPVHVYNNYWSTSICAFVIVMLLVIIVVMCKRKSKHTRKIQIIAKPVISNDV